MRKHLFVVNPAAGKHDNVNDLRQRLESLCKDELVALAVTKYRCHAIDIVRQAASENGELNIYACGGDGTLNEVVNGAVGFPNVMVSHYPCGTGNDFLKCFDCDLSDFSGIHNLMNGDSIDIDLYSVNGRYGINIGSVGMDSRVGAYVHHFKRWPLVNNKTAYNISVLYNVIKGIGMKCRVKIDERDYSGNNFTMLNACNGRYYGGGFYAMPDAMPNDGLLDFMLIKRVSRIGAARVIGKFSKGLYRELGDIVTHVRGKKLEVIANNPMPVNIDGEIIRTAIVTFAMSDEKIRFIAPKGVKIKAIKGNCEILQCRLK